ncbi:MAG: hypothetical protein V1926_00485 [Candidatus Peregrinibacteria bacterium]
MQRFRLLLTLWLVTDLLLFVALYALAYVVRVGWIFSTDFPFLPHITSAAIASPLWLLVLATTRTFHPLRDQRTLRNVAYIAYAALVGTAFYALTYYFRYSELFSRKLLIEAFVLSATGTWIWHLLFQSFLRHMLRRDPPTFPTLIVGVTRESRALIEALQKKKNPLKPVAILDGRGWSECEVGGIPNIGKLNKLEETLEHFAITHLIQASDLEQSINLLSACRKRGITYMLLPSVLGIVERDERVESLEGYPVTVVRPE